MKKTETVKDTKRGLYIHKTYFEKEYIKFHGKKAINAFFKAFPEIRSDWQETFEYMEETGTDFFSDNRLSDGSKNQLPGYAIHFDDDPEGVTYLCVALYEYEEIPETIPELETVEKAHITTGNTKTGIMSVNFLAGNENRTYNGTITDEIRANHPELVNMCGTCNADCPGCYAKAMTRFTDVYMCFAKNTYLALKDPALFVASLEMQLFSNPFTAPRVFRLHDSGDFVSYEYFVMIMDMIRRHPETRFGAYTKRKEFVDRYGAENIPENLSLQCSPWVDSKTGAVICAPIGDLPQFIYDDHTNPELEKLPHCPAVDKDGKRTGVQCINCLHCYTSKKGDRWAVYAH